MKFLIGTPSLQRKLKKDAIPSQFTWTKPAPAADERKARYERRSSAKPLVLTDDNNTVDESSICLCDDAVAEVIEVGEEATEVDSDITVEDQIPRSSSTASTQTPSKPKFDIDDFISDDAGIHFYTGLENYMKFKFVLSTLGPAAYCLNYVYHNVCNISVENQFFLVVIKLRRGTTNFEMSRMFNISESTV